MSRGGHHLWRGKQRPAKAGTSVGRERLRKFTHRSNSAAAGKILVRANERANSCMASCCEESSNESPTSPTSFEEARRGDEDAARRTDAIFERRARRYMTREMKKRPSLRSGNKQ